MESGKKVVIVGSGIGGLVCGAVLSLEGYHVTVLDMNKQIGGNLQSFARDKKIFDSGVHYVGGLDEGQNLYKIFKYLGIIDKFHLQKLDETFDKIVFLGDKKVYKYNQGYPKFIEALSEDFPDEKVAIEKYCEAIQTACSMFPLYNLKEGEGFEKPDALGIDTKAFLESLTSNKRLQNVLAGNNLLYAGEADKTPWYVHALVLNSYIESSYRFVHGGSQIAKQLTRIILKHGGVVKNHTEVKKFVVGENRQVTHVECQNGVNYEADYFISSLHPAKTLQLTESDALRPAYRKRISTLENSSSAFVIYATLKPNKFKYENTNYYCYKGEDVWESMNHNEQNWPLSYAVFYSGASKDDQYTECMTIMCYMHFSEVEKWKDTYNTVGNPHSRGEDYEEFKKRKAEILLDLVEEQFPGLRDSLYSYYTATPLTFRDYMGTDDGSVYGIMKDYRDPLKTFISPRTRIENLLLTGQNINLHGVLGVTISSLVTCTTLIGKSYLIEKIEKAQKEELV